MFRKIGVLVMSTLILGASAGLAQAATSPTVHTGSATKVKQTSVVLNGTVNPNGTTTYYVFRWGLTTAYGLSSHVHNAGSGTKTVSVSAAPSSLIPGTVYHYQIIAISKAGTSLGADRTFKTAGPPPPTVATGPAGNVTVNGATLTGVINPNGAVTGWKFQYGLSTAYTTYTNGGSVASGKAPVIVSEALAGLAQGTVFHYRLVAFHGTTAVSYGTDQIFMTEPSPKPKPAIAVRTRPRHARRRPYLLTTSGRVRGPSSIASRFDCNGNVAVRFYLGARDVAFTLIPLQPDCTFSGQTLFKRLPGHGPRHRQVRLRVAVRFRGNGYLMSVQARARSVTLG